jgi:hypothetical protein
MDLNRLRLWLGPDRETLDLIASLELELVEKRLELDEARDLVARGDQRAHDLRRRNRELQTLLDAAYEPVGSGECTKIRYTREDDAFAHAEQVAVKNEGTPYGAYQCHQCPPYILTRQRPWHAGNCRESDAGSVRYYKRTLTYGCGCVFGTGTQEWVWKCEEHQAT